MNWLEALGYMQLFKPLVSKASEHCIHVCICVCLLPAIGPTALALVHSCVHMCVSPTCYRSYCIGSGAFMCTYVCVSYLLSVLLHWLWCIHVCICVCLLPAIGPTALWSTGRRNYMVTMVNVIHLIDHSSGV